MADLPVLAGVELGGTKCICTLARGPGQVLDQRSFLTTTPDETLGAICNALAGWQYAGLGIGSFGPIGLDGKREDRGRILSTNKPGWPGAPVLDRLKAVHSAPVELDTDVNGAALAEINWGCAKSLSDFAYVTVGTGVGVGLIVNGRPTRGIGHSEIGHLRVPRLAHDDAPSACRYHDDCVEGLASGSALRIRLGDRSPEEVGADDPVWTPIIAALAAMCHAIVTTTGPMRIAIGGGVPVRQPHLLPRVEAALRESLNGYIELPTAPYIVTPALGDLAGPLGSIALARKALRQAAERAALIE